MKISNKDAKLLYIVGGLLFFCLCYVYGFQPMKQEYDKKYSELAELERDFETLQAHYAYKDTYETKLAEYREAVKQDMAFFPAEIKEEDVVAYILNLQENHEIDVTSISFQKPVNLVNFNGIIEVEGVEKKTRMQGQKIDTIASIEVSYDELKNVLQYIYDTQTMTTLEKITLSYNKDADTLSGSMDFARYVLTYEEAEYVPEVLPEVEIGQEDPFGED